MSQTDYEKYLESKNQAQPKSDYEKYLELRSDVPDEDGFFAQVWDFINSGANGAPGIFTDPVEWATSEKNPSLQQSTKNVVGGITSGLTFGAIEPFKNDAVEGTGLSDVVTGNIRRTSESGGYRAGRLLGEIAPLGLLSKGVGALKGISSLPNIIRQAVTGGIIGTATGTARETVGAIKGEGFNPVNIAIEAGSFAVLDGLVGVGGVAVQKAIRNRSAKEFAEAIRMARSDGKVIVTDRQISDAAKLIKRGKASPYVEGIVNKESKMFEKYGISEEFALERANATGKEIASIGVSGRNKFINRSTEKSVFEAESIENMYDVTVPPVTRLEESILKSSSEKFKGGILPQEISLTNPIRWSKEVGDDFKKMTYDVARETEHYAVVESKNLIDAFNKEVKGLFGGFSNRVIASNRIGEYAVAQQKGGKEILEKMGREIPELTEKELSAYNNMRGKLEKMYVDINEARIRSGIKPFPKVDNYFTFWRAVDGSLSEGENMLSVSAESFMKKLKKTQFRFEKKRIVDNYGELSTDAFRIFENYMNKAIYHKHMTPVLSKFRQMLDGKFYSGFKLIEENPALYKEFNDWTNSIGGAQRQVLMKFNPSVARMAKKLNENIAYAVLSYNLRSTLIQPTALVNSTAELGSKWVKRGVTSLFSKTERDFALANSKHLSSREFDVHIIEAMNSIGGRFNATKKAIGSAGIKPLQILDKYTAIATWNGAYKRGKSVLKLNDKEAFKYADDVVVKTQASGSRVDMAPIQRSDLGKFLTPFQTFVINNWGFLTRDVAGIGGRGATAESFEKVMRYITATTLINSLFEDVLQTRSPFPAPVHEFTRRMEKSDDTGKAFWGAMLEMAEIVPVVGGGLKYRSGPFGAGVSTLKDASDILSGEATMKKSIETLGKIAGLPGITQIKKFSEMVEE